MEAIWKQRASAGVWSGTFRAWWTAIPPVFRQQDDDISRNWEAALAYCQDLDLGGSTDRRLPDVKELRSIVDNTRYAPAIDTAVFSGTKWSWYWSSSTRANTTNYAWSVYFYYGYVSSNVKTFASYVRCVR